MTEVPPSVWLVTEHSERHGVCYTTPLRTFASEAEADAWEPATKPDGAFYSVDEVPFGQEAP